jgi:effector-binding domain-containing protein
MNTKRVIGLLILLIFAAENAMAIEEAKYKVVLKEQKLELREYDPHIVAETIINGSFEDAGSQAFDRLFKYISGNNQSSQEIAMTAPVAQEAEGEKIAMTSPVGQQQVEGKWAISFMMPASYSLETLPQPKDPAVKLRQVPARHMAVVRYSGTWSEKNYAKNLGELNTWIEENNFDVIGAPIWARYNPPFMPWFLRRNEILIPVENPSRE